MSIPPGDTFFNSSTKGLKRRSLVIESLYLRLTDDFGVFFEHVLVGAISVDVEKLCSFSSCQSRDEQLRWVDDVSVRQLDRLQLIFSVEAQGVDILVQG